MRTAGTSTLEGFLIDWSIGRPPSPRRLPVQLLSKAEAAAELQRLQAEAAMRAAYQADLVLKVLDATPDTFDPPPGSPGARKGGWSAEAGLPVSRSSARTSWR